jgi:hypothetical protein
MLSCRLGTDLPSLRRHFISLLRQRLGARTGSPLSQVVDDSSRWMGAEHMAPIIAEDQPLPCMSHGLTIPTA